MAGRFDRQLSVRIRISMSFHWPALMKLRDDDQKRGVSSGLGH